MDNDGDGRVDEGFSDTDEDGLADCMDEEECDELDNDGDGDIDEGFDLDADGVPDCQEVEECNGLDDDADGEIDEDFDLDGDGSGEVMDVLVPGGVPPNYLTDSDGGVLPYCNEVPDQPTTSGFNQTPMAPTSFQKEDP